ncbi:MAG: apolipoprotein N-acyltransferase [Alphaproteobacteria bacterium]|nr:apolipoprotein N-acyltransferase [Alphaproteobacteria bacterium]
MVSLPIPVLAIRSSLWFQLLAAAALGAAAALALAPLYLWPLMVFGYAGLLLLVQGSASTRRAFGHGWAFGTGYFLVGLHWVGHAFMVDAERFAWLMPFALLALAAGLALFPALAAALTRALAASAIGRWLAFTLFWGLTEWLRGSLLTGFPWLLSGHVWAASDFSLQAAAYLGASGLGLLAVLAAAAPALMLTVDPAARRRGIAVNAAALVLVALALLSSQARLPAADVDHHPTVRLRLVQAGIPQADKWRPELRDRHLALYLNLSLGPNAEGKPPDFSHLIWPETATPFFLANDGQRRGIIARALPGGSRLITGSPRRGKALAGSANSGNSARQTRVKLYNSVLTLAGDGVAGAIYDKHHLVPFGEYLPLRGVLTRLGVDKLAHGAVDFSPGPGPRVVRLGELPPFRPLICYEIIFPREIFGENTAGAPEWLLNLTNDAWFGDSFGPHQHLAIARIRAVELGLPVVRAANTGISAVIDPFGRIGGQLPLAAAGVIDSRLPSALPETLYRRFGDAVFVLLCSLLTGLIFLAEIRRILPRRPLP